jgi:hypothetical protein
MPEQGKIALDVPSSVARAYRQASPAEHRKFEKLLALSLRARTDEAAFTRASDRLERTMDAVGENARERGLTDAALQDLLSEEDE